MADFDLDSFLPYKLATAAALVSRQFSSLYRARFGISVAEWRVVAHLAAAGPVSVREIHARVDLEKSRVSRAAARLEAAGHLHKTQDPGDRRLVVLALTPQGEEMMAELAQLAAEFQARLQARLGPDASALPRALAALTTETLTEDG